MAESANQNPFLHDDGDPQATSGTRAGDGSPCPGLGSHQPRALSSPLPLGKALLYLPTQYVKVLRKPRASTFAEEMGQASWTSVLVQLVGYALLSALLGYLRSLVFPIIPLADPIEGLPPNTAAAQALAILQNASVLNLVTVPITLCGSVLIRYLLAKVLGGQGTLLRQSYSTLLFQVPLGILIGVLNFLPVVGPLLIAPAVVMYTIVPDIASIMAVHRLSSGKASAVVLIPSLLGFLLDSGLTMAFFFLVYPLH
jgi:hypothetical protein